jgi:hypothetical protein
MSEIVASMTGEHRASAIDDIPMPFDCRYADIDVSIVRWFFDCQIPDCPIVDEKRS